MTEIFAKRMTGDLQGDFAVFLIGMRFNHLWKIHKWLPVVRSMGRMLQELGAQDDSGFLGHQAWFARTTIMVQYWRSFDQLENYAKNRSAQHLPAWAAFNRQVGSNGDVGIWHETFLVRGCAYECVYNNMPRFGLAKAGAHVPALGKKASASGRIGLTDGEDAPVDVTGNYRE
jgi:hypothetical protein